MDCVKPVGFDGSIALTLKESELARSPSKSVQKHNLPGPLPNLFLRSSTNGFQKAAQQTPVLGFLVRRRDPNNSSILGASLLVLAQGAPPVIFLVGMLM